MAEDIIGAYPTTLNELLKEIKDGNTTIYSGGTDLMVTKRFKNKVVFINNVPELKKVYWKDGDLFLGAACTYDELISTNLPSFMSEVFLSIAGPAIRNRGTIGGNICNASPAGDTLPMWYALHASVILKSIDNDGKENIRELPIEKFILGIRKLDLKENEILTEIKIPGKSLDKDCIFYTKKVGARRAEAISKVSFFGTACIKDNRIISGSCAFGSVGITVVCPKDVNSLLSGLTKAELNAEKEDIIKKYMEYVKPIDDQRSNAKYRKKVAENLLQDFLNIVTC